MWTMSRKPRVVIIPATAPSCCSTAFVATVVPWKTPVTSAGASPASAQSSVSPVTIARSGSAGVDGTLCTWTPPDSVS
jgi:hypothetical protein